MVFIRSRNQSAQSLETDGVVVHAAVGIEDRQSGGAVSRDGQRIGIGPVLAVHVGVEQLCSFGQDGKPSGCSWMLLVRPCEPYTSQLQSVPGTSPSKPPGELIDVRGRDVGESRRCSSWWPRIATGSVRQIRAARPQPRVQQCGELRRRPAGRWSRPPSQRPDRTSRSLGSSYRWLYGTVSTQTALSLEEWKPVNVVFDSLKFSSTKVLRWSLNWKRPTPNADQRTRGICSSHCLRRCIPARRWG